MKRVLFFCIFLVSSIVNAADFVKGDGSFVAEPGDSHSFIKDQLKYEGTKSILSKELETLGLNKDLFWEKYDENLNERYTEIETNLKETLKIDDNSDAKAREDFLTKLRSRKLTFRKSFASMDDMLPKFVIKKISRSQKNPRYRYIRMEGEVNRPLLTKTYFRFIRGKKTSDYGSLFINVNYQLKGVSYSDLGIENENDFEGEVTKNWLNWFRKHQPPNIANTEILSGRNEKKLQEYLKLPNEAMITNIPEVFVNSLLLEIEVVINRTEHDDKLNQSNFNYEGFAYLKDLQTNLVVKTYNFPTSEKSYKLSKKLNLANIIANHVYQMAGTSFSEIVQSIKEITPISSIKRLVLTKFKNINEIDSLLKLVESRGVKYSLRTKLESISKDKADVIIYYDGDYNEIKSFFHGLQAAKNDLSFDVIESDNVLGIKFNRVVEKL